LAFLFSPKVDHRGRLAGGLCDGHAVAPHVQAHWVVLSLRPPNVNSRHFLFFFLKEMKLLGPLKSGLLQADSVNVHTNAQFLDSIPTVIHN
jgi:hypothetical protein